MSRDSGFESVRIHTRYHVIPNEVRDLRWYSEVLTETSRRSLLAPLVRDDTAPVEARTSRHVIPKPKARDLRWYSEGLLVIDRLALAVCRPQLWDPSLSLGMTASV